LEKRLEFHVEHTELAAKSLFSKTAQLPSTGYSGTQKELLNQTAYTRSWVEGKEGLGILL
jgi:hypothetical protein